MCTDGRFGNEFWWFPGSLGLLALTVVSNAVIGGLS